MRKTRPHKNSNQYKQMVMEQNKQFILHRQRIRQAKSIVDHQSPKLHAPNFLRVGKLKDDAQTYLALTKNNMDLLVGINRAVRTYGSVNSFNNQPSIDLQDRGIRLMQNRINELEVANKRIGKRILHVRSEFDTRKMMCPYMRKNNPQLDNFVLPVEILRKYRHLKLPQEKEMQLKLLRPMIYFDLEMNSSRPLGRVTIQLFTEAAPEIVMEFMRICSKHRCDAFKVIRLFPGLWLEGEIQLDSKSPLIHKEIEYDMRALDHGAYPCVFSFSKAYLGGFKTGFLNFSISFKKLGVLNGQRIGFGRVLTGNKILQCMQDYGTKNGKPIRLIEVCRCGVL